MKSIRYKGGLYKTALKLVVVFLVLGYYGTQPVTTWKGISQTGTCSFRLFS